MKFLHFLSLLFFSTFIFAYTESQKIYVINSNNKCWNYVEKVFKKFNIPYETTDTTSLTTDNLYLLFDIDKMDASLLPKHYMAYQSVDLSRKAISPTYLSKLSRAIAIWDCNRSNIKHYDKTLENYYYFPENYEYCDPIILPCFLPTAALDGYKKTLIYSNHNDTDISSHLPALYCHCCMQNPNIILELGVRGGESTFAFKNILDNYEAKLMGVDIAPYPNKLYSTIKNAEFYCMNDLDFPEYMEHKTPHKNQKVDVIFIDTSHLYEHTLQEIKKFVPLLSEKGMLLFHDSNVTPINGHQYYRINHTIGGGGFENTRGVTQAIKEYFSISFNEHAYTNLTFTTNKITWHMIHYPFCNGLTVLKKIS